jgi:hypothetical protein
VPLQQNTDRIQTTHIGSLPRSHRLLDLMKAKYDGQHCDEKDFGAFQEYCAQYFKRAMRRSNIAARWGGVDGAEHPHLKRNRRTDEKSRVKSVPTIGMVQ